MQNASLVIRLVRPAVHSVFGVSEGQKKFYDPVFARYVPYASGQQVKRSFITMLQATLNESISPTTFVWDLDVDKFSEGEVISICDPRYADQLLGGWMSIPQGGKIKTLKRRSPLSFSAFHPLHPLLSTVRTQESLTFDRSEQPHIHKVLVRERLEDGTRQIVEQDRVVNLLSNQNRSLLKKWIKPDNNTRLTGIFVEDVTIDLNRLFCVSDNDLEPEITPDTRKALIGEGWIESENIYGKVLVCPKERRDVLIKALAHSLINWKITSNQSRTHSLQENAVIAISFNANRIGAAVRGKITDETRTTAQMVIDQTVPEAFVYVTPTAEEYVFTEGEMLASENAVQKLIELLSEFDYEKGVSSPSPVND